VIENLVEAQCQEVAEHDLCDQAVTSKRQTSRDARDRPRR
jgi:hypothetical protein